MISDARWVPFDFLCGAEFPGRARDWGWALRADKSKAAYNGNKQCGMHYYCFFFRAEQERVRSWEDQRLLDVNWVEGRGGRVERMEKRKEENNNGVQQD